MIAVGFFLLALFCFVGLILGLSAPLIQEDCEGTWRG